MMKLLNVALVATAMLSIHSLNAAEQLEEIQVFSSRQASIVNTTISSSESISSKELEQAQVGDLKSTLDLIGNVGTTNIARDSSQKAQIRGISQDKLTIMVDGIRENFESIHNNEMLLEYNLLKRVDAIKGPSSTLYGQGAIGGVLSFDTKNGSDFLDPSQREGQGVNGKLEFATVDDLQNYHLNYFKVKKSYQFLIGGSYKKQNNMDLSDGPKLPHSESERHSMLFKIATGKENPHQVKFSVTYGDKEGREPNNPAEGDVSYEAPLVDMNTTKSKYSLEYGKKKNTGLINPKTHLYYTDSEVEKTLVTTKSKNSQRVKSIGVDLMNFSFFELGAVKNLASYGVETIFNKNIGKEDGGPYGRFPDGKSKSLGLFVQDQFMLFNTLSITPGVRYDDFDLTPVKSNLKAKKDSELTKNLSLGVQISENHNLYVSYSEGFDYPRMQDLYVSGEHFPGNNFVPNEDLKSERSRSIEAGLKSGFEEIFQTEDFLSFDLSVFKMDAEDFISRKVNHATNTTQYKNFTDVEFIGGEVAINYEAERFQTKLSYNKTRSENNEDGSGLDDTMPGIYRFTLNTNFLDQRLVIGYLLTVAEDQYRISTPKRARDLENQTKGYTTHDMFIAYAPKSLKKSNISLRVSNLFEKDYRIHGSVTKAPARDIRLAFSMQAF